MNVKVTVDLCSNPSEQDYDEMYMAAKFLTNDIDSIYIYQPMDSKDALVAEFTITKARQVDVVDRIGKKFSHNVASYSQSSISFPKKATRKILKKSGKPKYTLKQGQYLSFIYYFSKVNSAPPSENDFQRYFKSSLSAVRRMLLNLEKKELIVCRKIPFFIKLRLERSEIPDLE